MNKSNFWKWFASNYSVSVIDLGESLGKLDLFEE